MLLTTSGLSDPQNADLLEKNARQGGVNISSSTALPGEDKDKGKDRKAEKKQWVKVGSAMCDVTTAIDNTGVPMVGMVGDAAGVLVTLVAATHDSFVNRKKEAEAETTGKNRVLPANEEGVNEAVRIAREYMDGKEGRKKDDAAAAQPAQTEVANPNYDEVRAVHTPDGVHIIVNGRHPNVMQAVKDTFGGRPGIRIEDSSKEPDVERRLVAEVRNGQKTVKNSASNTIEVINLRKEGEKEPSVIHKPQPSASTETLYFSKGKLYNIATVPDHPGCTFAKAEQRAESAALFNSLYEGLKAGYEGYLKELGVDGDIRGGGITAEFDPVGRRIVYFQGEEKALVISIGRKGVCEIEEPGLRADDYTDNEGRHTITEKIAGYSHSVIRSEDRDALVEKINKSLYENRIRHSSLSEDANPSDDEASRMQSVRISEGNIDRMHGFIDSPDGPARREDQPADVIRLVALKGKEIVREQKELKKFEELIKTTRAELENSRINFEKTALCEDETQKNEKHLNLDLAAMNRNTEDIRRLEGELEKHMNNWRNTQEKIACLAEDQRKLTLARSVTMAEGVSAGKREQLTVVVDNERITVNGGPVREEERVAAVKRMNAIEDIARVASEPLMPTPSTAPVDDAETLRVLVRESMDKEMGTWNGEIGIVPVMIPSKDGGEAQKQYVLASREGEPLSVAYPSLSFKDYGVGFIMGRTVDGKTDLLNRQGKVLCQADALSPQTAVKDACILQTRKDGLYNYFNLQTERYLLVNPETGFPEGTPVKTNFTGSWVVTYGRECDGKEAFLTDSEGNFIKGKLNANGSFERDAEGRIVIAGPGENGVNIPKLRFMNTNGETMQTVVNEKGVQLPVRWLEYAYIGNSSQGTATAVGITPIDSTNRVKVAFNAETPHPAESDISITFTGSESRAQEHGSGMSLMKD